MCNKCHVCGCELREVLDGESWCSFCAGYRRYTSHGWGSSNGEAVNCPPDDVMTIMDYYRDNWLNYSGTPAEHAKRDILEGYRNIEKAREDYESKKGRDFSHFIGLGYPVTLAGLLWAINNSK